jgi:hypothetical protein
MPGQPATGSCAAGGLAITEASHEQGPSIFALQRVVAHYKTERYDPFEQRSGG